MTLQYGLSAAPTGRVWYVVIHAAHHTVSDFLYRIPDGSTSMPVGVGPPTGGSGATDDYTIRLMLIDAKAAQRIGAYSDTRFAPAGSTKVASVTIHRQPATG